MESKPLVSIVTPVYNGQRHLRTCIDSVLAQTWTHFEYVIVNNRSTDDTLAIAEEYAQRDPRIRITTNDAFVGVIENHNRALDEVAPDAKYIKLVHADDWLFPECVEKMVAIAERHPSVGLIGAYRLENSANPAAPYRVASTGLDCDANRVDGQWMGRAGLRGDLEIFGNPTTTMLRAEAARALLPLYNEDHLHADTEACYRILEHWDFGFVHQVLTFMRNHDESVTQTTTRRVNTHMAANLEIFLTYGPRFMPKPEFEARRAEMLRQYYRFLARRLMLLPGRSFWDYHEQHLDRLGASISRLRLIPYMFAELLGVGLDPSRAGRVLRRRVSNENWLSYR